MDIITTHRNADFDALASVFASSILYPRATPVVPKILNPNVRAFLSIHKDHFSFSTPDEIDLEGTKRLIVVDVNRWARLDGMDSLKGREGLEIHLWDHHQEPGDINAHWSCQEPVGSTTTLLVRRLEEKGEVFSSILATLFLTGIYEDTGNLTFPSTTAVDAKSVAFLLEQQADLNIIKNFIRPIYGPRQKEILFEMLKSAKRLKLSGYDVSFNRVNIEGHTPGLSLIVDMYEDIMNVDAAFGIFPEVKRNRCMVIGRSASEGLDIGSIMRSMGGGGHPNAGSALLRSVDGDSVEERISELIQGTQQSSVRISDLMSFPVSTVSPDTPMKEVALLLREKGFTGVPVVEGERLVGIISRRDFGKAKGPSQMGSPVKAFMSEKVIHIDPGTNVIKAARLMVRHDIGRLPVVENGKLIGIVTRSDAMRYYYDLPP